MKPLKRPAPLKPGDTVAAVSLSNGLAGIPSIRWRYEQGKQRLQEVFGLKVVEMPHTLDDFGDVYAHPEHRAADLLAAFADPQIKGIVACIGGNDSIRMLSYIDYDVIANNPKVFLGYSDTTVTHLICYRAGIASFYGPTLLVDFAENVEMHPYTVEYLRKALFTDAPIGEIAPAPEWTAQFLAWDIENKDTRRTYAKSDPFIAISGEGTASGQLFGGCIEVLEMANGTLMPDASELKGAILFLETSDEDPSAGYVEHVVRSYGARGILDAVNGIVWGKPVDSDKLPEYTKVIKKVMQEYGCEHKPVIGNLNFGHTEPKICIPYGTEAEITVSDQNRIAIRG
jgi:muramoyltetrapeptide carboxypeptidase LdcA involved in peptidoglycan recycling